MADFVAKTVMNIEQKQRETHYNESVCVGERDLLETQLTCHHSGNDTRTR